MGRLADGTLLFGR